MHSTPAARTARRARRVVVNGIGLHVEIAGDGAPVLLLHGFTGSAATWEPLLAALAPEFRVVAIDLIGHGRSDVPPHAERYTMEHCGEDLLALLDEPDVAPASRGGVLVVGYSMGGRVALHLAATALARVAALILIGASPGLAGEAARAERVQADEALAGEIERDGVAAFVARWERLPLFSSQAALPEHTRAALRDQRLRNSATGLANSLRGMGAGRQEPLWDRLPAIGTPTLVVAGALDEKYRDLAARMAAAMPAARLAIVPRAGHAVHLEQPAALAASVRGFLRAQASGQR